MFYVGQMDGLRTDGLGQLCGVFVCVLLKMIQLASWVISI